MATRGPRGKIVARRCCVHTKVGRLGMLACITHAFLSTDSGCARVMQLVKHQDEPVFEFCFPVVTFLNGVLKRVRLKPRVAKFRKLRKNSRALVFVLGGRAQQPCQFSVRRLGVCAGLFSLDAIRAALRFAAANESGVALAVLLLRPGEHFRLWSMEWSMEEQILTKLVDETSTSDVMLPTQPARIPAIVQVSGVNVVGLVPAAFRLVQITQ